MSNWFLVVAVVILAAGVGYLVGRRHGPPLAAAEVDRLPADEHHVLDLLRRANRALVASLALPGEPAITTSHPKGVDPDVVERAEAMARLALADGRAHIVRDSACTIAVGEGDVAVAIVVGRSPETETVDRIAQDMRQLAAGFDAQRERERVTSGARRHSGFQGHETMESAALALCEGAREVADVPTAVALVDGVTGTLKVVSVSAGADRRLIGTSVAPNSAAGRAASGETPVAALAGGDLFGHFRADRRRQDDQGLAFPLSDGKQAVGALIALAAPAAMDDQSRSGIQRLALDAGPHIANLVRLRSHETRAMTDELTGLPNRRALNRALALSRDASAAALLILDVDRFKSLNDTHGHEAGDAALRHLAKLLRRGLRERDTPARMGGEEFAMWLPETALGEAEEVAERIRYAIETTPLSWKGRSIGFTCSIGVAAVPDVTGDVENLYGAADAALYRAKEAGRNRVVVAVTSVPD